MNIYIISNYYNIDTNVFEIIKSQDLVVFMNNHFHDGTFFNNNEKLLFIRRNPKSYWGYQDNYNNRYSTIYFVNGNLNDKELQTNIDTCPKIVVENTIKNYSKDKVPTTGFIVYFYLKNKYPTANIFLIGFTGGSSYEDNHIAKIHDYEYEQKYYHDNNVNLLNREYNKKNIKINLPNKEENKKIENLLLIKNSKTK
jgi:hypothetical protein